MTGGDCVAARNVAAALFNTSIAGRSSAARHQFRKSLVSFAGSEAIVALYGVDPAYHVKRCAIEAVRAVNLSYPRTQPQGGVTWTRTAASKSRGCSTCGWMDEQLTAP